MISAAQLLRIFIVNVVVFGICVLNASDLRSQTQQTMVNSRGQSSVGELVNIAENKIVFISDSVRIETGFKELALLNFDNPRIQPNETTEATMKMVDGSVLKLQSLGITKRTVTGRLQNDLEVSIARTNVHSLKLKDHADAPEKAADLSNFLNRIPQVADEIVIHRDEFQTLEGVIGELAESKINFTMDEQTANVSLRKLEGMLFYHAAGRELVDPVVQMQLTDGSNLMLRSLATADGETFRCLTVSGSEIDIKQTQIAALDFSLGRTVYLSDLTPSTIDWEPLMASRKLEDYLRRLKLPRMKQTYTGDPLTLQFHPEEGLGISPEPKTFEHGIAMTGGSRVSFAVDGRYQRLTGYVGFDPDANDAGDVMLTIRADGKKVLESHLVAQKLLNPIELNLEIANVQRITFQVGYHDGRAIGDNIHLVDLKATK